MIVNGQALTERFEIRRRLGAGGMGEVFEAFDREQDQVIALKTLSHADPHTVARFKREFRVLQSLSHPNLVSLGELVRDADRWFFTMELVEGRHFLEYVRPRTPGDDGRGQLDEVRLRHTLVQLVRGLGALHVAGLVHRDVKPSNIMVTREGRVVLLDFGLVTDVDPSRQSTDGRAVGTVDYMAPEQAAGHPISEAADWYAVGIILYEALTGRVPFSGHLLQILVNKQQQEPPPPEDVEPGIPLDLAALCRDLLRIEPERRPRGADIAAFLGISEPDRRSSSTASYSSHVEFVGRSEELARLDRDWDRARTCPVFDVVIGDSGIGKSALVQHFARSIIDGNSEAIVLHGRCYERESVPFKALDGVADGLAYYLSRLPAADAEMLLPGRAVLLPRLFPVFQQVDVVATASGATDASHDAVEQRRRMFMTFRRLVAAAALKTRVLIVIEDLQWADADSFLLLRELLRGRDAPRVLVIATVRGDRSVAAAIADRLTGVAIDVIPLGPLGESESRLLAARLAPAVADRYDLDRLCREAGGHPLFLQELVRHVESMGALGSSPQLDDALWSRMALLGPDARALLEVVCVAGAPVAREVAMLACRVERPGSAPRPPAPIDRGIDVRAPEPHPGLDGTAFERSASSLRVASLVREIRRGRGLALEPYHDRVREAVVRRLDGLAQRQLHARLAVALERADARDPQLLLRHFLLAGIPDRAARYAENAAQRSMEAHAFDQAAELWKTSLELLERPPEDTRRLRLKIGEALVMAGRGADAAEHYLAAAAGADPPTRLECHRHAAEQLLISGRIERGVAVLEDLLAEIRITVPPTPKRALAQLLWTRAKLRVRGLDFKERHRREIADADMVRLGILEVAAHGLAMVDSIRGADFQSRHLLLALRTGHRTDITRALLIEGMFQATAGNIARARSLLDRAREVNGDDSYYKIVEPGANGMVSYFAGNLASCIEGLTRGDSTIRQHQGMTWEAVTVRIFVMFALRFIGDFVTMRGNYDRFLLDADLRGDQYMSSTLRRSCTPLWLAEDAPAEALRDVERASWVPTSRGFHVQHFHELVARGEVALYTGVHHDRAQIREMFTRLDASLLRRVASIRDQAGYLDARLALLDGDRAGLRRAERLARKLARHDQPIATVWSLLVRGSIAVRRGDLDEARACFERADQASRLASMRLSSAVARLRLASLRGGSEGVSLAAHALSDMAALGVRNPDRMAAVIAPVGGEP